ncbi:hypothetical protein B0H14DRAFT_2615702 [Mycena olivaceomarginata]|nr:hypothetical protein B0H14DRAFT_2615702 [Mycena olivaceomarginata]
MPAIHRNRRLQNIVRAASLNPVAVAVIPDPYPSDGPGVNYIVTRDLVADVAAYEQGQIDQQTLLSRREIKMGESKDFFRRRHGYAECQRRYRHECKAMYTTPERKLTEHLVQDETRSRAQGAHPTTAEAIVHVRNIFLFRSLRAEPSYAEIG